MAKNKVASKYGPEHRAFIEPLWAQGVTAQEIAQRVNATFGMSITRNAIISRVSSWKLPKREQGGIWRVAGAEKRAQTMIANGGYTGGKKRSAAQPDPVPSEAPLAIGPIDDHVDHGCCKWPVNHDGQAFQQCGQPAIDRKPYCLFHRERAKGAQAKPMVGSSRSDRVFR